MGKATGAGGTTINDFELVGLVTFGDWLRLVIGLTEGGGAPARGTRSSPTALQPGPELRAICPFI
jgi:hypothetical protein